MTMINHTIVLPVYSLSNATDFPDPNLDKKYLIQIGFNFNSKYLVIEVFCLFICYITHCCKSLKYDFFF